MNREKLENYLEKNPFAKLSEVVTQILYDQIVVLDIPPASKLNINQIATDLGISRTPVVEAINRLQAIGFVETKPKASGFYVTDMNLLDMIDLYDARTAIECEAAALCADKASPEAIAQLDNLATEFKKAVPRMDGKRLKETDMPFHKLIVEASGNKYLIRSYNELLPNLTMYQGSWPKFISSWAYARVRASFSTRRARPPWARRICSAAWRESAASGSKATRWTCGR